MAKVTEQIFNFIHNYAHVPGPGVPARHNSNGRRKFAGCVFE
jgi:hypothetical protein